MLKQVASQDARGGEMVDRDEAQRWREKAAAKGVEYPYSCSER